MLKEEGSILGGSGQFSLMVCDTDFRTAPPVLSAGITILSLLFPQVKVHSPDFRNFRSVINMLTEG